MASPFVSSVCVFTVEELCLLLHLSIFYFIFCGKKTIYMYNSGVIYTVCIVQLVKIIVN